MSNSPVQGRLSPIQVRPQTEMQSRDYSILQHAYRLTLCAKALVYVMHSEI